MSLCACMQPYQTPLLNQLERLAQGVVLFTLLLSGYLTYDAVTQVRHGLWLRVMK